ncbi:MAG: rhodanese-like domain-containing protein [Burkholderiales bacterium]|nr:rhodanese-like domain-containing protein [Burkholderiales bacterium]
MPSPTRRRHGARAWHPGRGAALVLCWALSAACLADEPALLRIIGQDRQFIVQTANGPIRITRSATTCAPNKGYLQPLVPAPGVQPVTEIEVLQALNDAQTMVIDMRDEDDPLESTIPHSYHIPFNELEDRMDELGCTKRAPRQWDCAQAPRVVAFCNGPVCPQSPQGIAAMIRSGFPADRIAYYRGGMMDWEALGLTTVRGNRPTKRR